MIRAVGFDLGGTLIEYEGVPLDWQQEYPTALTAVASLWTDCLPAPQLEAGTAVLRRFNTRLTPRACEVDHTVIFGELLTAMNAPPAQVPALIDPAADAFFTVFQRRARPVPEARQVVDAFLGAGIPVGVLTDVPYGMPRRLALSDLDAAGFGVLAATTVTSVDVGVRKPDPRGFVALATRLSCSPHEMLFVGNEQKDVQGALAAGMSAVMLWRGDTPTPTWGQHHCVSDLAELGAAGGVGGYCPTSGSSSAE